MGFLAEKKLKWYHVLPITVIGAVVILINGWVLYQVIELGNSSIIDENDLVENLQVFCYSFSAVILLVNAFRVSKLTKWLNLFFGVTCLSFVLRELDVEDLNVPDLFILLGSGKGRNIMFIVAFTALFSVFFKHYRYALSGLKRLSKSPVVQICLLGCILLMLGVVGEENDMELLEEVSEMNGAKLIAISALVFVSKPRLLMDYIVTPEKEES
jgi:magnesium-transporting ATPase (P-type)